MAKGDKLTFEVRSRGGRASVASDAHHIFTAQDIRRSRSVGMPMNERCSLGGRAAQSGPNAYTFTDKDRQSSGEAAVKSGQVYEANKTTHARHPRHGIWMAHRRHHIGDGKFNSRCGFCNGRWQKEEVRRKVAK